ncbi:glycine zipper family protein [Photobacterium leiognathi subsp. mandapamensis]
MMSDKFIVHLTILSDTTLSAYSGPMTPVDKELVVDINGEDNIQYHKDYSYSHHITDNFQTPEMTSATQKRAVLIDTLEGAILFSEGTYDSDNYDTINHQIAVDCISCCSWCY